MIGNESRASLISVVQELHFDLTLPEPQLHMHHEKISYLRYSLQELYGDILLFCSGPVWRSKAMDVDVAVVAVAVMRCAQHPTSSMHISTSHYSPPFFQTGLLHFIQFPSGVSNSPLP